MEENKKMEALQNAISYGMSPNPNRRERRQGILANGMRMPKRPFNNRANTSNRPGVHSRTTNQIKKKIYAQLFGR